MQWRSEKTNISDFPKEEKFEVHSKKKEKKTNPQQHFMVKPQTWL